MEVARVQDESIICQGKISALYLFGPSSSNFCVSDEDLLTPMQLETQHVIECEAESTEKKEICFASCEGHDEKELALEASLCTASSQEKAPDWSGASIFKVVPIKVWAQDKSKLVCTYAYIDEGCSVPLKEFIVIEIYLKPLPP